MFPSPKPSCLSFPLAPIPVTHTPALSPIFSRVPSITSLLERSLFTVWECWNVSACAEAYICPERLSRTAALVGSDIACTCAAPSANFSIAPFPFSTSSSSFLNDASRFSATSFLIASASGSSDMYSSIFFLFTVTSTLLSSEFTEKAIISGISTLLNCPFTPPSASITVEVIPFAVIYLLPIVCSRTVSPFRLTLPFTVSFVPISAFVTAPFPAL